MKDFKLQLHAPIALTKVTDGATVSKAISGIMKISCLRALLVLVACFTPLVGKANDVADGQTLRKATCVYVENEKRFPAIYSQVEEGKWRRAKYVTGINSSIPETDYKVLKKDQSSVYLVSEDSFWGAWDEVVRLDLKSRKCLYFNNTAHKPRLNLDDPSLMRWDVELINPSL